MRYKLTTLSFAALLLASFAANAQLTLSGQLRTRTELRDGQGNPLKQSERPAFFTSQRTRLTAMFAIPRVKLNITLQDVRVWGQDVSMINRTTAIENNGVMFHEAWADILLNDTTQSRHRLNLKIGRQELVYDDQRLLGNLDWLQQARRHDAAVLKYTAGDLTIDAGAAFNQNREKSTGSIYDNVPPGNYSASTNGAAMYKSMVYLHASRKTDHGVTSFVVFSDQFNPYDLDSVNAVSVKRFVNGSWVRVTGGFYATRSVDNAHFSAAAYYQFGKNHAGKKIDGLLLTGAAALRHGRFVTGAGLDYTTREFDPLYGTPHKFWGHMDFFYAGSATGTRGLADYYLKSKFKASEKWVLSADLHHFTAATASVSHSRTYGQEVDFVATHALTRLVNIECGYAHFFARPALTSREVKNIADARASANWAYIMINIKPEFLLK